MPFNVQWLWLRSAVRRHRVLAGLLAVLLVALAAYGAPVSFDFDFFEKRSGWVISAILFLVTLVQWRSGAKKDAKAAEKEREEEFRVSVEAIAQPVATHALIRQVQEQVTDGFTTTNLRLNDLGERISCVEGRLQERRFGPDDRRNDIVERRALLGKND